MQNPDFIIIGQGLAGSLIAYELMAQGKTVQIFDNHHQGASSSIAAGIINPITGRRFAKSWRIDEFLPFAKDYYQKLEQQFNIKIFHDRSVLRFLRGNKDINDWYGRSSWDGFSEYMHEYKELEKIADLFHLPFGIGAIRPAAQIDLPIIIKTFKKFFEEKGIIENKHIEIESFLEATLNSSDEDKNTPQIVFCEGQQARFNPMFKAVQFEPAKGEVLFLKIPGLNFNDLIKNKLIIAPFGEDVYWTGSNYEWNSANDKPTEAFKNDFIKQLKLTLKLPFEVVAHKAAIRPTVKDRRPVLGTHPRNSKISIFNGLGTKGASLGPFWAKIMVEHLIHNKSIDPEVDVNRFYK